MARAHPPATTLPTLAGKAPIEVQRALTILHGHMEVAKAALASVQDQVDNLPDPHGALITSQLDQVRQNLLGAGNLLQQVNGFTQLPQVLPTTDPKQVNALWNDGGLIRVSAG